MRLLMILKQVFFQYFCAEFCQVNVNSIGKKAVSRVLLLFSLCIDSMKGTAFSY